MINKEMEDDSDNDEGFVTTGVEIKESEHLTLMHKNKVDNPARYRRPHDYQARYIFGDGLMRKEPVEAYNRFGRYIEEQCFITPNEHESQTQTVEKLTIEEQKQFELHTNTNGRNIYETDTESKKFLEDKEYTEEDQKPNSFESKKTKTFSTMNIFNTLNDVFVPKHKSERDKPGHPYNLYFANEKYRLLYSRMKDREETITEDNDDFTSNYVNLSKVLTNYDGDHYSILKPFEYSNLVNNNMVPRIPSNNSLISPGNFYQKPTTPSEKSVQNPSKTDLQFDSKFECGNLLFALRNNESTNSYILFIHNDTNSYGYNQWFYFSIKGACKNTPYRFSIVNMRKKKSMFQEGMQPSMFSLKEAQSRNDGNGWSKTGTNIRYEKSPIRKSSDKKFRFFCLSFEVSFQNDDDYVCLAMNTPYSYSRLLHHLKLCMDINEKSTLLANEENEKNNKVKWTMEAIGYSISNNAVPYITIESEFNNSKPENQKPKLILIMARQHPGETLSSFMMEEMLYLFAENNNLSISSLLSEHTIKIFPMVNVDGVIYGNFRCDIAGFDLNRNWRKPDKALHPQISSISTEIERLSKIYDIQCVLDLHGHSKKYNSFSYACKNEPISARVLSLMMSLKSEFFDFPSCTFGVSKYKETTARAVIYKMLGNENIITIENSFFGARIQDQIILYDPFTLNKLSESIFESILAYVSNDKLRIQCEEMIKNNIDTYLDFEKNQGIDIDADSGSESDPFVDEICIKEKIKKILPKVFITVQQELLEEEEIIKKKHIGQNNVAIKKIRKSEKNAVKIVGNYEAFHPRPSKKIKLKDEEEEEIETVKPQPIQRASLSSYRRKKNSKNEQIEREKPIQRGSFKIKQELKCPTPIPNEGVKLTKIEIKEQTPSNKSEIMNKVEDINLPFYGKEKQKLTPLKLKNELIDPFREIYNATSKHFDTNENKLQKTIVKASQRKVKLTSSSQHNSITEEVPLLCILSEEKKRRANLQKTYGAFKEKISISLPHKNSPAVMNEKLESMRKNRKVSGTRNNNLTINDPINSHSKIKDNATLISNAWRENFARYGKNLNVFFGGHKN